MMGAVGGLNGSGGGGGGNVGNVGNVGMGGGSGVVALGTSPSRSQMQMGQMLNMSGAQGEFSKMNLG
jgi:hypothetical protein